MTQIHQFLRMPHRPLAVAALAALTVAGCASPTPFVPRLQGQEAGYTDLELTPNRYRVTFTGNSVTPRETVETYLLLRAAEVTQAAGYRYFVFDTRNTRAHTTYHAMPMMPADPWFGPWYGGGRFWGGWGFAYEPAMDVVARTRYQAYAEIVLLTPEQANKEPRAIEAAAVITHLGPDAVPPNRNAPPPPPA